MSSEQVTTYQSGHTLASWTRRLLLVNIIAAPFVVLFAIFYITAIDSLSLSKEQADMLVSFFSLLVVLLNYLLDLSIVVLFLIWIHRVNRNLGPLGAMGTKYTPFKAVLWFIVPIANLYLPYLVVREIWQASDERIVADPVSWKQAPAGGLVIYWWVTWLSYSLFNGVIEVFSLRISALLLMLFALMIASSIGAMKLIREIDRRQQRKFATTPARATVPVPGFEPVAAAHTRQTPPPAKDTLAPPRPPIPDQRAGSDRLVWGVKTAGKIESSAASDAGSIFFGSGDGKFYALDKATGLEIWQFNDGRPVNSTPATGDGAICCGDEAGNLFAIDAGTGTPKWSLRVEDFSVSSPVIASGCVYYGGSGFISALRLADGATLWSTRVKGEIAGAPAYADGRIYFGSYDKRLRAMDAVSGKELWQCNTGGAVESTPLVANGRIYVGNRSRKMMALDLATGQPSWEYKAAGPISVRPALQGDTLMFGSYDRIFYALDASSGQYLWSFETRGEIASSPAIAGDKVYFGSFDGHLYCLEITTGRMVWNFPTREWIASSPLAVDGLIYFGGYDGFFYALRA